MNKKSHEKQKQIVGAEIAALDRSLDEWMERTKSQNNDPVFDPVVCTNYTTGSHTVVIDEKGRIKFASKFLTNTFNMDVASGLMKHTNLFDGAIIFDLYGFEFPAVTRRLKKQMKIVISREAHHTETRLDFRTSKYPKSHPMNSVMTSFMSLFHHYACELHSRVMLRELLTEDSLWSEIAPLRDKILSDAYEWANNTTDPFWQMTKNWVVLELISTPWGNQFDDIFDAKKRADIKEALPEDSGFFVK